MKTSVQNVPKKPEPPPSRVVKDLDLGPDYGALRRIEEMMRREFLLRSDYADIGL